MSAFWNWLVSVWNSDLANLNVTMPVKWIVIIMALQLGILGLIFL